MRILYFLLVVTLFSPFTAHANVWELRRDDLSPGRPAVDNGVVTAEIGTAPVLFPRYLNELGIKTIRIHFHQIGSQRRKLSILWTGGSQGRDKFAVRVDGIRAGVSRTVDSEWLPYSWHRDDFAVTLGSGEEHMLLIESLPEFTSAIELAGIRLAELDAGDCQPICYESIESLERYEKKLGEKGTVVQAAHLSVFAPQTNAKEARSLATFLEKAYAEMKAVYGADKAFKFSVEHYPKGSDRGWGGISGGGTIGYTTESLERLKTLGTGDVRGFAGYVEEMSHSFAAEYNCGGTYEALGVAVSEDVMRRLVPGPVADAFWLPEHEKWDETQKAYLAAGRKNPDPGKYPNPVLYTRILNALFLKLRTEYGEDMWPDFFNTVRQMDYPLHRTKDAEFLKMYADIFSALFGRDMRPEFESFGIDLDADPPWGWQTRSD